MIAIRIGTVVLVLACVGLLPSRSSLLAHPQGQRVSTEPKIHFAPLPPTLRQMAQTVDLVVLARVTKTSPPTLETLPDGREFVRRYQHVQPVEVLKGDNTRKPNAVIVIRQPGGTVDVGGREVSSQYLQRLLEPGDLVLLFLQRTERSPGIYLIAYGPSGAVWVDSSGNTQIPHLMRNLSDISGRATVPLDELLAILRRGANPRVTAPRVSRGAERRQLRAGHRDPDCATAEFCSGVRLHVARANRPHPARPAQSPAGSGSHPDPCPLLHQLCPSPAVRQLSGR